MRLLLLLSPIITVLNGPYTSKGFPPKFPSPLDFSLASQAINFYTVYRPGQQLQQREREREQIGTFWSVSLISDDPQEKLSCYKSGFYPFFLRILCKDKGIIRVHVYFKILMMVRNNSRHETSSSSPVVDIVVSEA